MTEPYRGCVEVDVERVKAQDELELARRKIEILSIANTPSDPAERALRVRQLREALDECNRLRRSIVGLRVAVFVASLHGHEAQQVFR